MKKLLIAMMAMLLPMVAKAHDIEVENAQGVMIYYRWINNSTELAVSYRGSSFYDYSNEYSGEMIIPESVIYNGNTYSVMSIGAQAFWGCNGLTSVAIPNSVTSIGSSAFSGCSGLTSVTIGNCVTSIGSSAFSGCSGLTSVTIGNCVTSIGVQAFNGCSGLTSVTIPNSVTSIGNYAFQNCSGLTTIFVESGNPIYDSRNNCNAIIETATNTLVTGCKNTTIPNSVTTIGEGAFSGCSGLTSVTIGNSVTLIGQKAFYGCRGLTSVTIPNSVTSIGNEAFYSCSGLKSVTIGNSVTSIGGWAFGGCLSLTSITIPSCVVNIGNNPFIGCRRLYIKVEDGNPVYDSRNNCNAIIDTYENKLIAGYNSTVIPNSVVTIGREAFASCEFTTINIPNSVTTIEYAAFLNCRRLTSIKIPKSVTYFDASVLDGCVGLTSINVEEGNPVYDSRNNCNAIIDTNSNYLIKGCKSSIIPNGVTGIADYAFGPYPNIDALSIIIPSTVSHIGYRAFNIPLKEIKVLATIPPDADNSLNYNIPLYVPESSIDLYKATEPWSHFASIEAVSDRTDSGSCGNGLTWTYSESTNTLTISGNGYMNDYNSESSPWQQYKSDIQSVVIESGVRSIGTWAFNDCINMKAVTFSSSLIRIGDGAFEHCVKLASVDIPQHVHVIEPNSFSICSNLSSISIPNSVTSIGDQAFYYCSDLASVTIPNSVTSIGHEAFWGCSGLASIEIPNNVTSIREGAFGSCSGLTTIVVESGNPIYDSRNNCNAIIETSTNTLVTGCMNTIIPNSVTSIGHGAFFGCSGLTSVTIPNSVTSIGYEAFHYCSALTSVTIGNSTTSIGGSAFHGCSGLTSIEIPKSVTSIGNTAFAVTGLTKIVVESGNPKYDSRNNCNAIIETGTNTLVNGCKNTIIPNSVTSIGGYAFYGCFGLTSITIPNSVTSIGDYAFNYCSNLTSVIVGNEIPLQIESNVFSNRANATLYVPVGCKAAYEAADYWNEFKEIIEMPANGDLNGDGIINGIDLVAQTNLIMTNQYNAVADLNNDGVVNGLDYVIMVNMIMSFTSAPAMQATGSNRAAATSSLSIENFDIMAGETKEMFINLSNPDMELTLLQFDMRLPDGLSIAIEDRDYAIDIAGRTNWRKHSLMASDIDDVTRIMLASNTNALIDGNDGNVISIKLTASDSFTSGDIMLENQLLVSPDAEDVMPADFIYSVGNTTSVNAIMAGQPADVYTLTGSKVRHAATSLDGLPKGVYIVNGKKVIVK